MNRQTSNLSPIPLDTSARELYACPQCKGALRPQNDKFLCVACNSSYPVIDAVPCFNPTNTFYDEYAAEHCPYALSPHGMKRAILSVLPFWSYREWRFWGKVLPECQSLLDIGCGKGREIFRDKAKHITGYDSSIRFATECRKHYDNVAVGNLPRLPFRPAMFDAVVSSHVIGHVAIEDKDKLVREIVRVLKPGGTTAHIIETDSIHPAVLAAKSKPRAYLEKFIDQHGHIGLERASVVIRRFEAQGLRLLERRLVDAVIPSVLNARRFFNHPEFADIRDLKWSRRFERWTAASSVANAAYEVGAGAFHRTCEKWFGDPDRAQFLLVAFQKA
jgi:ubiquinone/menaquinone biosynthesis C-methylase UbiE/uncharacterized protein YbaR (Trm112 family)